jgi:hypothetical protein
MAEINFAEREAHIRDNPTLDECISTGRTHAAYRWASSPWGHWTDEQKAAYRQGFLETIAQDKGGK